MFSFFRRTKSAAKPSSGQYGEPATSQTIPRDDDQNKHKNIGPRNITAVSPTSERSNTLTRKDVVNLLIPETDYNQQRAPPGPVATLFNKMAGHKKRGKRNNRNHWRNPQKRDNDANETKHEDLPKSIEGINRTYREGHMENPVIPMSLPEDDFDIYETVQVKDYTKDNELYQIEHMKNERHNNDNHKDKRDLMNFENNHDEEALDSDSGMYGSVTVKDRTCHKPEKLIIEELVNLRKEVINGTSDETYENATVGNENIHESDIETCTHIRDGNSKYIPANTSLNENVSFADESADFVRDLVLAKYARSPTTTHATKRPPHVSLVYVSHDPIDAKNTPKLTKDSTQVSSSHQNIICASDHFQNQVTQNTATHLTPIADLFVRDNILNNDNVTEINISDTDNTAFTNDNSNKNNLIQEEKDLNTEEPYLKSHVNTSNTKVTDHNELLEQDIASFPNYLQKESQMGASDSKNSDYAPINIRSDNDKQPEVNTPQIQISKDESTAKLSQKDDPFKSLKQDLTEQLEKIYQERTLEYDSQDNVIKKSNLKPPRSDTEGCSDDDRSEGGGKKVTFKKVIHFDDGDTQTDEEKDSSFESFESTSDEESESEEESDTSEEPDNDEMLGGVVVARTEPKNASEATPSVAREDASCLPTTLDLFDDCQVVNEEAESIRVCEEGEEEKTQEYNSDSGFVDTLVISDCKQITPSEVKSAEIVSDSESEENVTLSGDEESELEEEEEEEEGEEETSSEEEILEQSVEPKETSDTERELKNLVSQESRFACQVSRLSDAAAARAADADELRALVSGAAKQIEAKDAEIERLKDELERAYKESELIRQRLRSLEDELSAARTCSADLASKLHVIDESNQTNLKEEVRKTLRRCTELERRVHELEQERGKLEQERDAQTKKAEEVVALAAAGEARWRRAHEAARTQASERAERVLADCEWKMRELEKRARDSDKKVAELTVFLEKANEDSQLNPAQVEELTQLRGLIQQQQQSIAALSAQCAAADDTQRALQLEVARLKELLDKEKMKVEDMEKKHKEELTSQITSHSKVLLEQKERHNREREHCARAESERLRAHAERTRSALAQLRDQHAEEKRAVAATLGEAQAKLESLQEEVARKEEEYSSSIAEARSKADWELLHLRHLLDRADVRYASQLDAANEKHEKEIDQLNSSWSARLAECSAAADAAAVDARGTLETTRANMNAERLDQLHRLKEEHRREMERQWERFMADKEECLSRMKIECHEEGEETRVRGEKDLMDEISELRAEIATRGGDLAILEQKAANCSRTLEVTEQELREALEREKKLRCLRSEDSDKHRLAQKNSQEAVDHLTRKCACLRKLFDDLRGRMEVREQAATEAQQAKQREILALRSEVARLTKAIMHNGAPPKSLGARTRADGCDEPEHREMSSKESDSNQPSFLCQTGRVASDTTDGAPRGKGGGDRKRRSKSVDLPAVQVPSRIKQLEGKNV